MSDRLLTLGSRPLLQLSAQALLDRFGEGKHVPGSGSAAAMLGLLSCKMMQTVITVSRRNPSYRHVASQLDYIERRLLEKDEPFFRDSVQRDAEQFNRYYLANERKRNAQSESEKRRLSAAARRELMPSTEIPLQIAGHAAETAGLGLIVFDLGAKHVRGDSGVAIASALASCSSALFIVYLNLKAFREGQWATSVQQKADSLTERLYGLQNEQFRRVARLQAEGRDRSQLEFDLFS